MNYDAITPRARVRIGQSFIGTVEQMLGRADAPDDSGRMIVLSDDSQYRYSIPLSLIADVQEVTFPVVDVVVDLRMAPEDLTAYMMREDTVAPMQANAGMDTSPQIAEGDDVRVPLRSEELTANTQSEVLGHVRVHKSIESREERFFVPVQQEQAVIERIPADQYDGKGPRNENEMIIPLMEERLVVQKQLVVKEYLRIYKEQVNKQLEVRGNVRREVAHITEEPSGATDEANGATATNDPLFRMQSADDTASPSLGAR